MYSRCSRSSELTGGLCCTGLQADMWLDYPCYVIGTGLICSFRRTAIVIICGELRSLVARSAIELPVADAAYKGIPLCRSEVKDRTFWVLAVADPDHVVGQACDLHAVTVVSA
jgi:hypothetical protein